MHLKRLKVRNFKSFAGSVEIPFQPGFTGIAGPNGMGKSNISDAILFVLGPTSSKALRADRLTHLFFNGGSSKKPATECEVSLVFDNKDRLIPIETDDVEVSRYVKLQPSDPEGYYSYFYINGRRTTQSEIDLLLSHARLSGDGYNLVQQGDVNRIVSMGPIPRRGLVERLAGISQYDEELERADAKRTALEGNLTQIQTLLGEIRSRLGALESQRLQAIQYKQLQDQKRQAEARLAHADLRLARHEVESCREMLAKVSSEIDGLQTGLARQESERDRLTHDMDRVEQEIAARAGAEGQRFKADLDAKRLGFARLDQQFQSAGEALSECERRLAAVEEELAEARGTETELSAREQKLARELADVDGQAERHRAALKEATGGAEKSQGRLSELRQKILTQERDQQTRSLEWQASVQAVEAARAQHGSAERELAQAEEDEETRQLELRDLELRIRQGRQGGPKSDRSSADLQKELFRQKARERTLSEEARTLSSEVLELNRRYMALDARLKARADQNPRAGSQAAVEYLLSLRNLGKLAGIRGTVEELTRVEAEHHTALTVAAGARFQSLVVENDQVAEECINLLRSEKRGRATFLPLNRMLAGRPRGKSLIVAQSAGAVGFAVDLVKFDEELRPAFWYVFGETVVMKDLAGARSQMGGVRLVTLAGELIESTGAITGGFIDPAGRGRGGESAVELRRLGEELREKSGQESAVRAELEKIEPELRRLSEELARRSGEVEAQGSALKLLDKELAAARERLTESSSRVARVKEAKARSAADRAAAEAKAAELEGALTQVRQQLEHLNELYHQQLPGSISGRLRTLQEASEKAGAAQLELAKQVEAVRSQALAAHQAVVAKEHELGELKAAKGRKSKEIAQIERARAAAQEELEKLKTVESEQLKAVEGQTAAKRQMDARRLKLVEEIARAQEVLRTRRAMQQNEEVRRATAERRLAELEEAIRVYPEIAEDPTPVPLEELRRGISAVSAQLEAMGAVNLRALEEYDSEKSRLDQFEGEVGRLTSEKTELQGLVGEIEKKKRTRISEVVRAVTVTYHEIYSELSGGGEGEISLENPDDPLAGGLLIKARPVGKNVQRLEQLSGGEKSLASLAFVFALQRYDPSPLYVFDEVDMSLDGINAENVGRLLRRNAERAQFIVISLRKVTLKFAHRLFGVTMHGDGCSRVVGLALDEIVDMDDRERAAAKAPAATPEVAA